MKRIIRLTEGDLRNMISHMTKNVLNEIGYGKNFRGGYVKPDGNSMTGGYYGGATYMTTASIAEKFLEIFAEVYRELEDDVFSDFEDFVYSNEDNFVLQVKINSQYDESTGYGSSMFPVNEIEDVEGEEEILELIEEFPFADRRFMEAAQETLDKIVDSLDANEIAEELDANGIDY